MSPSDQPSVRLRPEIVALPAYRQGKAANAAAFKLSSNENPFDPLPGVVDAVNAVSAFNRYPDASALALRERLAARYGLTERAVGRGLADVEIGDEQRALRGPPQRAFGQQEERLAGPFDGAGGRT